MAVGRADSLVARGAVAGRARLGGLVPRPAAAGERAAGPDGRAGVRILLVEDDAGDAVLVEELLTDSGLTPELRWVRSLAEAETALTGPGLPPHCVLLDLHLPDAEGLDGLRRVLRGAPQAAVVVLTGLAEEQTGLEAVAAGAQDYLVKGKVEGDLLGRAIRYAIQRKEAEQVATALQASRLRAAENARLERGLLPKPLVRDPRVRVCARYHPGRQQALIGGDFYDVVQAPDGAVHVVVGDVSGHGPDEAALGVCLRVAWRAFVLAGVRGAELLGLLERVLVAERSAPEIFATVTHLSGQPHSGRLDVIRAGHPGLLVREPDGAVRLVEVPGGPALGIAPELASWPVTEIPMGQGAAVVAFTDGLIEGRIGSGPERLGEAGLLDLARRHARLPPDAFVDALIHAAQQLAAESGGLADDLAVLHLEWSDQS
jgi:serine phosphatase RsbU (regulator of sigma subunit)